MGPTCRFCEEGDETSIYLLGQLDHLGEYLIPDTRFKYLQVGNTANSLPFIGLIDILQLIDIGKRIKVSGTVMN